MTSHDARVARVAEAIRSAATQKQKVRFEKEVISHFVPNPYASEEAKPAIDFKPLNRLLDIDEAARTATVEPGLTFHELVRHTLPKGLMPVVVPELKTITVGGAISGCSLESTSYRYGGFHDNCLEYEYLTGTGEVRTCSPEKDPDVFHLLHGSYGTLGRLTKATFKLIPAKPYVKMEYRTFSTYEEFWKELNDRCDTGDFTFIDGIVHSKNQFVLCLGEMVDSAPYLSDYEWLNVFYKSTLERKEDYLTAEQYFFRYDAECHWLTKTIPLLETKPMRALIGKLVLGSTNLITWSQRLRSILRLKKRPEVVVDVFIPRHNFDRFYKWYETDFDFYPLWIVPYKMSEVYPWVDRKYAERMGEAFVIDAAVYGKLNNRPDVDYSELLEKKVTELDGIKTLISRNHYDEETFWTIYNRPEIEAVKKKLDPENLFGELYAKFSPDNYR